MTGRTELRAAPPVEVLLSGSRKLFGTTWPIVAFKEFRAWMARDLWLSSIDSDVTRGWIVSRPCSPGLQEREKAGNDGFVDDMSYKYRLTRRRGSHVPAHVGNGRLLP